MVRAEPTTVGTNLMSIWYYNKDIAVDVLRQMKIHLSQNFEYSLLFNTMEDLTGYLAGKLAIKRIVFIISSTDQKEATAIERLVRRRPQFQALYQMKLEHYESSALPDLASVRSIIERNFKTIMDDLQKTGQPPRNTKDTTNEEENAHDEYRPVFDTFKSISAQRAFSDLSKESLKFLLFQALIEALVRMPYNENAVEHMWNLCHMDCIENPTEAKKMKNFKAEYTREKAINYYTQSSSFFRLVNRAFRLEDVGRIFHFGCYIADLHRELEQLDNQQRLNCSQCIKTFYRGKRYSAYVVQQFLDNIGHLVSMNGLLSATKQFNISTMFAGIEANQDDYQSIIFELNIDRRRRILIRPYANIRDVSSCQDENEVLFFMGFVWKIESMEEMIPSRWYVVLQSCEDYNPELITYIEQSRRDCTYLTLGNISRELGDYSNAKNFYQSMLKDENASDQTRGHVYFNMGILSDEQGEYLDALKYFHKAQRFIKPTEIQSREVTAPSRPLFAHDITPSRLHISNNIGRMHLKDGEYQSAQDNFEKALQQPGSAVEMATVWNNYGLLEFQRGNIEKACGYLEQAVQLAKNDACLSEFKRNHDAIRAHIVS